MSQRPVQNDGTLGVAKMTTDMSVNVCCCCQQGECMSWKINALVNGPIRTSVRAFTEELVKNDAKQSIIK